MYIVKTDDIIKDFDDFKDVKIFLYGECAKWVRQPNFIGNDTAEELFNYCMKEQDFGDIADVYKVEKTIL